MQEKNIDIWERNLDWIVKQEGWMNRMIRFANGMVGMKGRRSDVRGRKMGLEEYPVEFLEYVKEKYEGQYWHGLPREMVRRLISHGHTRTGTDRVKDKR